MKSKFKKITVLTSLAIGATCYPIIVAENDATVFASSSTSESLLIETNEVSTSHNSIKSTSAFNLNDWKTTLSDTTILLEQYIGTSQKVHIPGEHQGKQVILSDFSALPRKMTSIQFEAVNNKKVKLSTKNMEGAFESNRSLQSVDLSGLDTSGVTNMSYMFSYSRNLTSINLKGLNTSSVTDMSYMFNGLDQLSSIDVSSFNTLKVTNMNRMFYGMKSLKTLDLTSFNVSKVETMVEMFANTPNLKIMDLTSFKTKSNVNMTNMFNLLYADGESLLIATTDSNIKKSYPKHFQNRNIGFKVRFDFNGGLMDNTVKGETVSYGNMLDSFDSKTIQAVIKDVQADSSSGSIVYKNHIFDGWKTGTPSGSGLEKIYNQLTGPYEAQWTPVTLSELSSSSTTLSGKGAAGATVKAYVNGKQIGTTVKVDSSGSYKMTIPKQAAKTKITIKMSNTGAKTVSLSTTVLNAFNTFTYSTPTPSSTTITGKGVAGAKVGVWHSDGTRLALVTVDSNGNYSLTIPKQKAGTVLTIQQEKNGYLKASKKVTVLNQFDGTFTYSTPSASSTTISGKGFAGASVGVWHADGTRLALVTVNSKGNYKATIPAQKAGTVLTIQQQKDGYQKISKKVTVLNEFKTFTYSTPTISSTTLSGKGVAGAKVGAYTSDGKRLALTTVNSNGNYKLTIPTQKAGTVLTLQQEKNGYLKASKKVTVLNEFGIFTVSTPTIKSTMISGRGMAGADIKAYVNGKQIGATAKVDSNGNYKLTIPTQKAGATIVIKMSYSGYKTISQEVNVFDLFNKFTASTPTTESTTISGVGTSGATVRAYVDGKQIAVAKVDSKGSYKLTIPKQKAGKVIQVKMTKLGFKAVTQEVTVLKAFTNFTVATPNINSTSLTGTGVNGASVQAYVDGKQIGSTVKVNSNGNYKLTIPTQKAGAKIEIKISKDGYKSVTKKVTVLNIFTTFRVPNVSSSTTTISGKGEPGATIKVYVGVNQIGNTVKVDSKGNYNVKIPKQKAGATLKVEMTKSGYQTITQGTKISK